MHSKSWHRIAESLPSLCDGDVFDSVWVQRKCGKVSYVKREAVLRYPQEYVQWMCTGLSRPEPTNMDNIDG